MSSQGNVSPKSLIYLWHTVCPCGILTVCFIPSKIYIASTQCTVRTNLQCACALKENYVLNAIYLVYNSDWSLVTGIFFRCKCFVFLQTYLLTRNLLCFKHIFDCFKYARLLLPKLEKKSFILYQITRVMLQLILFIEKKFSLEKERSFKFRKTEECLRAVLGTD